MDAGVQRQPLGGDVELLLGDLEQIEFLLHEYLLELFRSGAIPGAANPPIRGHPANFSRIIVTWGRLVQGAAELPRGETVGMPEVGTDRDPEWPVAAQQSSAGGWRFISTIGAMPTLAVGMLASCRMPRHAHGRREHGARLAVSPGNDNSARSLLSACLKIRQSASARPRFRGLRRLVPCRNALPRNRL